jgi:hypothetical protein
MVAFPFQKPDGLWSREGGVRFITPGPGKFEVNARNFGRN